MFKTYVGALSGEEGPRFCVPKQHKVSSLTLRTFSTALEFEFRSALHKSARVSAMKSHRETSHSGLANSNRWRSSSFVIQSNHLSGINIWRNRRLRWYTDLGLAGERLRLREHDQDELSHYSCGTAISNMRFRSCLRESMENWKGSRTEVISIFVLTWKENLIPKSDRSSWN